MKGSKSTSDKIKTISCCTDVLVASDLYISFGCFRRNISFEIVYVPSEWRLFVKSLKVVLLHNGNKVGSVPIGHSVKLTECYKAIKIFLESLQYRKNQIGRLQLENDDHVDHIMNIGDNNNSWAAGQLHKTSMPFVSVGL